MRHNTPFDAVIFCIFRLPDSFGQFGGISFMSALKAFVMVVEASFKFYRTTTIVKSGGASKCYRCFIHTGALMTFFSGQLAFLQLHSGMV